MENDTYLKYIDYYLPENKITVDSILEQLDNSYFESRNINRKEFCLKFKNETKLNDISVFKEEDNLISIISNMLNDLFKKVDIDPLDVGYIVCGNEMLLKYNNASIVHFLQKEFNLENSTILPILQPCSASLFAMGLSRSLLNDSKRYMLVLTACKWEDIGYRFVDFTVRGDGVGLLLIGSDEGLLKIANWNSCNMGNPSFNKIKSDFQSQDISRQRSDMITRGVSFIEESLKKCELKVSDIEAVIPPNVRYDVFHDIYSYYLKIDPEKFYLDNVSNGGHICDIDLVRNLKDYLENKKNEKINNIVMYTPDVEQSFDVNYHFVLLRDGSFK